VIIIGAQKAGTTSLFYYLAQHPQIRPPLRKEVHYFSNKFAKGTKWYRAHFPLERQLSRGQITFEASPSYLSNPLVPARIAELLPKAKLIAVLRDPTKRAVSHYFHSKRHGREALSIEDALAQEEQRLAELLANSRYDDPAFRHLSYKRRGHYWEQLEPFRAIFPPSQLLILSSDELFTEPESVLRRVSEFIGIDPSIRITDLAARNTTPNRMPVSPGVYEELERYFRPHNERLFRMLGQDFGWSRGRSRKDPRRCQSS
jgi:hypothetical protein